MTEQTEIPLGQVHIKGMPFSFIFILEGFFFLFHHYRGSIINGDTTCLAVGKAEDFRVGADNR